VKQLQFLYYYKAEYLQRAKVDGHIEGLVPHLTDGRQFVL
jgi:hypothetical protein